MRLYVLQISSWPTDLSSSETVVHSLYTLELKKLQWDGLNLSHFHGEGCDWANHPKSTKSLDVRYHHRSSPKIFQVSTHHFFQLQRLFSSSHWRWYTNLGNHVAFAQKNGTSPHLAWQHCHDLEFQIRKAKPALPVVDLRKIDYGMKRYVLHICCLDNHISCTASGSENGGLHKPNALCTQRVALKNEFPDSLEKKLARIQQCSIKVLGVLIPWKGTEEKFTDILSSLTGSNFPTGLLIGLEGFNLALLLTGFSLESCFLPYLLRETDQQPGQKSIWAKSHLLKWCSQWLGKQFHFKALLNEGLSRQKWFQKSGCLTKPNGNFSRMSFMLRKFEDPGYVVATNYKSARNRPTNIMEHSNTPTTLDFASYIRHLRLGHLPAPIKDLQDARWTNSYQNDVNKFKTIP